jgi:hypothetical protein
MLGATIRVLLDTLLDNSNDKMLMCMAYESPTTLFFAPTCTCKPQKRSAVPGPNTDQTISFLGSVPWPYDRPKIEVPYSKEEILEFHEVCRGEIEDRVQSLELDLPSGFPWLRLSRMELHIYNIRQLQHHAGQLIDRLRTAGNIGVAWVGSA